MLTVCLSPQHGSSAASLAVAEQYVQAFGKLAKTGTTVLLPERTGDIGSMVAKVMYGRPMRVGYIYSSSLLYIGHGYIRSNDI